MEQRFQGVLKFKRFLVLRLVVLFGRSLSLRHMFLLILCLLAPSFVGFVIILYLLLVLVLLVIILILF